MPAPTRRAAPPRGLFAGAAGVAEVSLMRRRAPVGRSCAPRVARAARRRQPNGEHFTVAGVEAVLFSGWQSPMSPAWSTTALTETGWFCGGAIQAAVRVSTSPGLRDLGVG